jgi:hypothetical protein
MVAKMIFAYLVLLIACLLFVASCGKVSEDNGNEDTV